MPQINLLQQQKKSPDELWRSVSAWSVKILLMALVLLAAYYIYLIFAANSKNQSITGIEQQLLSQQQDLNQVPGKEELFTRQQQLQQLLALVAGHPYWSNLLPALASATLKTANFISFQAMNDGTITLSVSVPSTQDLDKFLQVFDLPEFNQNFYDIKVGSIGKTQVGNQLLTQFNVNMSYNPNLLKPSISQ